MARLPGTRVTRPVLLSCGVHTASRVEQALPAQPYRAVQLAVSLRGSNAAGSRGRSQAPRRRDRIPRHLAHLGTEPATPSTSPLSRARRRPFSRPQLLGATPVSLLPPSRCYAEGFPRQVSRRTQTRVS